MRQKDTDEQWVTYNAKDYFGYKNHIKADSKPKLITGYKATKANIHDSEVMDELLDKREDSGQPLHADSAYRSEAMLTGLNYIVYSNSCLRSFFV